MKHLRIEPDGRRKYRRRVSKELQSTLGKTEFVKMPGKTEAEALRNYGPCHDHIERILRSANPKDEAAQLVEIKKGVEAQLQELGLDLYSSGFTEDERIARSEEADSVLREYTANPKTGSPDAEDVSLKDGARVTALMSGAYRIEAELSITQAFDFYLSERWGLIPTS